MRSLPKIIKQAGVRADEVFCIPDPAAPKPPSPPDAAAEAPRPDEGQTPEEAQKAAEISAAEAAEQAARRARFLEDQARAKAEEVSQRILQTAKAERAQLLETAAAEAEKLRQEARQAAYDEALQQKRGEIVARLSEMDALLEKLQGDYDAYVQHYEEGLVSLTMEITQKVLGEALAKDNSLMLPLVNKAVAAVKNEEWISVEVSGRMPGLAEELRTQLAGRQDLPPAEVTEADTPIGSCIVHTPKGIVDASFETQVDNLKALFESQGHLD